MSLYDRMRGTATRLLATYKQGTVEVGTVTTTEGATEYAPPTVTTTWEEVNAVVSGVSRQYVDGTNILASDRQVMVTGVDIEPGGLMRIDGDIVTVLQVQNIPAAGDPVAVRVFVR